MELVLIVAALILVALILLKAATGKAESTTDVKNTLGYRKKKTLFTEAERSFLGVLDQCIDLNQYRVFGKVRVADIVEPNPSKNRSEWQKAFNPIKAKHFDYVICAADTLKPVCAIELDDKSHNQKKRQQRDQLLESVCKDANLPLIRVPAKRSYKPEEVKGLLAKLFAQEQFDPANNQNVTSHRMKKIEIEPTKKAEVFNVQSTGIAAGEVGGEVKEV